MALIVVLGGVYLYKATTEKSGGIGDGIACTMEAKICPDGSAVGRTGPKCEFAECPLPVATSITIRTTIGQKTSGLGVALTPLEVTADSRCPLDVQCVWAGTVKVQTKIESGMGESTMVFELNQSITTETETITLKEVTPAPKAGVKINNGDYIFIFEVSKRKNNILPAVSGVRGTVLLGPTCPVMRDPPDPQCADKGYATTIDARRDSSSSVFATGKSETDGVFEFALPPGSYTLSAIGGKMLPRCNEVSVVVLPGEYAEVAISCDTGIR